MKKRVILSSIILPLLSLSVPAFAEGEDKGVAICHMGDREVALKLVSESDRNPEFDMKADLGSGLTAGFRQVYFYYGMNTFELEALLDGKVLAKSTTHILINDQGKNFRPATVPFLEVFTQVKVGEKTIPVSCYYGKEQQSFISPPDQSDAV